MTELPLPRKQIPVTDEMRAEIRGSWAEIDLEQMRVIRSLPTAQIADQLGRTIEQLTQAVIARMMLEDSSLTPEEARRCYLEDYYRNNPSTYIPYDLSELVDP
jgi:hypothetical protein